MSEEDRSKSERRLPVGANFLTNLGSNRRYAFFYEEHGSRLLEQYDTPDGLRFLRTGPVTGGTSRHPAEDWVSDRPLGPERTVQLSGIFVYNPKLGETRRQFVTKIDDYFSYRRRFEEEGWMLVRSGLDRVVGYRAFPNPDIKNTSAS